MEHLALYRKYRPKDFNEVVGQEHITKTLINQIKNNNISHAYLFCGTRGTGKTSIAKIFARAINCTNLGLNGEICGKCEACVSLNDPANLDIVEIDAASNNGVDNIRELREKIKYSPISCQYKVYIIDEVHMLSDSAFNAFLKTLEEPPKHAIFILATTESQKIPATIASRCLKFDFKLLEQEQLVNHLKNIFAKENIKYEEESVQLIASMGEGSVRDTLSVAEMCVAYSNNNLTYEETIKALGVTNRELLFKLASAILNKDAKTLIEEIDTAYKSGKSMVQLSKDLLGYFRDLMVVKTNSESNKFLRLPQDIFNKILELTKIATKEKILNILVKLSGLEQEFRFTQNPKTLFEITVMSLLSESDYEKLEKKVIALEAKLNKLVNP